MYSDERIKNFLSKEEIKRQLVGSTASIKSWCSDHAQVSPLHGRVSPLHGRMSLLHGRVSPLHGPMSLLYGRMSLLYG